MGPPCAGKSTAGERVAYELGSKITFISMGKLLMDAKLQSKHPLHELVCRDWRPGPLAPLDLVRTVFSYHLEKLSRERPATHSLLLDGIPRSVPGVAAIAPLVELQAVYEFTDISRQQLTDRLEARIRERVRNGQAPRPDDTAEQLSLRIQEYMTLTKPMLQVLPASTLVRQIRAGRSDAEVSQELAEVLREDLLIGRFEGEE